MRACVSTWRLLTESELSKEVCVSHLQALSVYIGVSAEFLLIAVVVIARYRRKRTG